MNRHGECDKRNGRARSSTAADPTHTRGIHRAPEVRWSAPVQRLVDRWAASEKELPPAERGKPAKEDPPAQAESARRAIQPRLELRGILRNEWRPPTPGWPGEWPSRATAGGLGVDQLSATRIVAACTGSSHSVFLEAGDVFLIASATASVVLRTASVTLSTTLCELNAGMSNAS